MFWSGVKFFFTVASKVVLNIVLTYITVGGFFFFCAGMWAFINITLFGFPEEKNPNSSGGPSGVEGSKLNANKSSTLENVNPPVAIESSSESSDLDILGPTPNSTLTLDLSDSDHEEGGSMIGGAFGGPSTSTDIVPFHTSLSSDFLSLNLSDFFNFFLMDWIFFYFIAPSLLFFILLFIFNLFKNLSFKSAFLFFLIIFGMVVVIMTCTCTTFYSKKDSTLWS